MRVKGKTNEKIFITYKIIYICSNFSRVFNLVIESKNIIKGEIMKDKFIKILLTRLNDGNFQASQVKKAIEDGCMPEDERVIPINAVVDMIVDIDYKLQKESKHLTPKTKFLCIEDGSVDVDTLDAELFDSNPEIKIIVYRQGSCPPILRSKEQNNERV